jgi:hypothetical protein
MGDDAAAAGSSVLGRAVEEVRSALNEHADVVADLFGRVSSELRTGFAPAVDSFIGFFHAVDWKVYTRTLGLGAGHPSNQPYMPCSSSPSPHPS